MYSLLQHTVRPTLPIATAMVPAMIQAGGQHHVGVTMVSMELSVPTKKVSKDKIYHYFMKRYNAVLIYY